MKIVSAKLSPHSGQVVVLLGINVAPHAGHIVVSEFSSKTVSAVL